MPSAQMLMHYRYGKTTINKEIVSKHCDHRNHVTIKAGHIYTFAGEYADNLDTFEQCLDCGMILNDSREWVLPDETDDNSEIPY